MNTLVPYKVFTLLAHRVILVRPLVELLVLVLLLQLLVLRFRNSTETEKVEDLFADKFSIFRVQELERRLVVAWISIENHSEFALVLMALH